MGRLGYADQPVLWQGDPRWGKRTVGLGQGTFGAVGCVVTSLAMALRFLGVRAGATPLQVQAAGLLRGNVWAPGQSGCVVPALVSAQVDVSPGVDLAGPGKVADKGALRELITETLAKRGVLLVAVDYDRSLPKGDPIADHWVCCHAVDGDDVMISDPATARIERLLFQTLEGPVKWGKITRRYSVARAVSVFVD
jgi:hypothetical protein